MSTMNFPETARKLEIQTYKKQASLKELRKTHVPFSGSPQKHPSDPANIILIIDPYSGINSYYEFRKKDISFAEELPSIVNLQEETITMARIWVKKKSVSVRCSPFIVEDTK